MDFYLLAHPFNVGRVCLAAKINEFCVYYACIYSNTNSTITMRRSQTCDMARNSIAGFLQTPILQCHVCVWFVYVYYYSLVVQQRAQAQHKVAFSIEMAIGKQYTLNNTKIQFQITTKRIVGTFIHIHNMYTLCCSVALFESICKPTQCS